MSQSDRNTAQKTVEHYLGRAVQQCMNEQFEQAGLSLDSATRFADSDEELLKRVESARKALEQSKEEVVRAIRHQVGQYEHIPTEHLTVDKVASVESALARLSTIEPENPAYAMLADRWRQRIDARARLRRRRLEELLIQIQRCTEQRKFGEAHDHLDQAKQMVDHAEQQTCVDHAERSTAKRQLLVFKILKEELENLMLERPENLGHSEINKGDELLKQIETCSMRLPDVAKELEELSERWISVLRVRRAKFSAADLRAKLELVWQLSPLLLTEYKQAVVDCQSRIDTNGDEPMLQHLLEDLLREARDRYHAAEKMLTEWIDQADKGNPQQLITEYQALAQQGCRSISMYGIPSSSRSSQLNDDPKVVITRLTEQAQGQADGKAQTLLDEAGELIDKDPERAMQKLEEALHLTFVSPRQREKLERFQATILEERLTAYFQVVDLIALIQRHQRGNPEQAWTLYKQARQLMPELLELDGVERSLLPWLRVYWDMILKYGEEASWNGDIGQARQLIEKVLDGARDIPDIADIYENALSFSKTYSQQPNAEEGKNGL